MSMREELTLFKIYTEDLSTQINLNKTSLFVGEVG